MGRGARFFEMGPLIHRPAPFGVDFANELLEKRMGADEPSTNLRKGDPWLIDILEQALAAPDPAAEDVLKRPGRVFSVTAEPCFRGGRANSANSTPTRWCAKRLCSWTGTLQPERSRCSSSWTKPWLRDPWEGAGRLRGARSLRPGLPPAPARQDPLAGWRGALSSHRRGDSRGTARIACRKSR